MRGFGEVKGKHLIGDGATDGYRQTHLLLLLETLASNHRVHRHDLWFFVRYLNTDSSLARHRGNDTNTDSSERKHNIVFESLDLSNLDTCLRYDLVERNGRTDSGFDRLNLNVEVAQGGDNAVGIGLLFLLVDDWSGLVVIDLEKIERRELIVFQVLAWVVWTKFAQQVFRIVLGELDFLDIFHGDIHIILFLSLLLDNRFLLLRCLYIDLNSRDRFGLLGVLRI